MNNFSYKEALRKRMYKEIPMKVFSNSNPINGLECPEFDKVIENDIELVYEQLDPMNGGCASRNTENLRRLKLLKIAKHISLDRNDYFNLKRHAHNKEYNYSSKNPKYLELYELNRLLTNCEYLRYILKSKLVNDIRNSVFKKISDNLHVNETILDIVKDTTQKSNTATSSSNAILSNNGSQNQERVKDTRLLKNKDYEKYQHNTKWIIFSDKKDSAIYQLPKMNGKYHTEFCLRYFIPNRIIEDKIFQNSIYTIVDLLNILLNIREHYNEYFLKVLKDNVINVFEGLSFDMQCILSPSLENPKNSDRARGIRKIVNLPISRNEKIRMLLDFKYYNKFKEVIYPFYPSNKYRIIINSSYHFVKDTSLRPTPENPNCLAKSFLAKFKLSFGVYQVSNNYVSHDQFLKLKENKKFDIIIDKMCEILKSNYYMDDFGYAIRLIEGIRTENDIHDWSNITPITVWFHEFFTFTDFSLKLYHKLFSNSINILKNVIDDYDRELRQIVTDEIYIRTNLVRSFLTKDNKRVLNQIIYTNREPNEYFKQQVMKLYHKLYDSSCKRLLKYFQAYFKIIDNLDEQIAHMLFNHLLKRYSYFVDTKCYLDPITNGRFYKSSRNYAFPMYSKIFSNILKKKKSKISDEINIYSQLVQLDESNNFDIDTEEMNDKDQTTIEYFFDDESQEI
jgi:hypothetical protein